MGTLSFEEHTGRNCPVENLHDCFGNDRLCNLIVGHPQHIAQHLFIVLAQYWRSEERAAVIPFDAELVAGVGHRPHLLMLQVPEVAPVGKLRVSL